jgi:hypothetical protein
VTPFISFNNVSYANPPGFPLDMSLVSYPGGARVAPDSASFLVQANPDDELPLTLNGPGSVPWTEMDPGTCGETNTVAVDANWVSFDSAGIGPAYITVSPATFTNCVGASVSFSADHAPGTLMYNWSASGATMVGSPTGDRHENAQFLFSNAGTATITATAGPLNATANGTVVEVASLAADQGQMVGGITDIVDWASSGVVTVTATPNPNLPPANLPGCWQMTGGTEVSKTVHTVPKSIPDITTIAVTAGTSTKTVVVAVVKSEFSLLARCGAPGHVWWFLELLPTEAQALITPPENQKFINTHVGYGPANGGCDGNGTVWLGVQNSPNPVSGAHTWIVTFNQLKSGVDFSAQLYVNPGWYSCGDHDCLHVALDAAGNVGVPGLGGCDSYPCTSLPCSFADWLNSIP